MLAMAAAVAEDARACGPAEARCWVSWSVMLQWRWGVGRLDGGPLYLRSTGARESSFGGGPGTPPGTSRSLLMRRRTADGERELRDGPSEWARVIFGI